MRALIYINVRDLGPAASSSMIGHRSLYPPPHPVDISVLYSTQEKKKDSYAPYLLSLISLPLHHLIRRRKSADFPQI